MTLDDVNEATNVLTAALTALQAAVPGQSGRDGAAFRYACGDLLAQAPTLISGLALGAPLRQCFDLALVAGATLNGLVGVRQAVWAIPVVGLPAIQVGGSCFFHALAGEVALLQGANFASSQDAEGALAFITAAIGVAQDWALDSHLSAMYQSLLALGATASRDLQARAAQLPRVTTYAFPRGMSSLILAYRLYGDANRANELRAENQVSNPAFMPASGTALSE